ncbi:MAG: hypothetical protein KBT19_06490 [Lachnospiraceae bacterium]|nr:hypothetical protein [Candidatus Colinaster equi]
MKKEKEGYITVYLSLTIGIMLTVIVTLLYGIRVHTIRYETECVMDIALKSIFAEYHREMLSRYGLLYIDSSYGGNDVSNEYTKAHLLKYMNDNFNGNHMTGGKDLLEIHADNANLENITYPSDSEGEVLRYQIDRYMKVKTGLGLIDAGDIDASDYTDWMGEYESYMSGWDSADSGIDSIMDEINSGLEEGEEPYSISNPADSMDSLSSSNALYYAIGDMSTLDANCIDSSLYISHRSYDEGEGLRDYQEPPNGIISRELFYGYIFDKCGYYGTVRENSALSYQIEYLLNGQDEDVRNMEEVAQDIFKIRYVVNMMYLFSDTVKQAEAEELALAATTAIGNPELTELVKLTILFAWGYAESAKDLRILYSGNSLSITKTAATWNTPITQLLTFREHLNEYVLPMGNLDYKRFLLIFLNLKDIDTTTKRLMDVMEMDIRLTAGNTEFKMDEQIYQLTAEVNISSRYGYGCLIRRKYSYE